MDYLDCHSRAHIKLRPRRINEEWRAWLAIAILPRFLNSDLAGLDQRTNPISLRGSAVTPTESVTVRFDYIRPSGGMFDSNVTLAVHLWPVVLVLHMDSYMRGEVNN